MSVSEQAQPGWDGLLDEGETILWQGRPVAGLSFSNINVMETLMGLFFMGFSLFWIRTAANVTSNFGSSGVEGLLPVVFPLFGVPFFLIGFYNAIGHILWDAFLRSRTHYTLTSKRAFIATDHPRRGKLLEDYSIDEHTDVTLKVGPPDSVLFRGRKIGFIRIEDGRAVHKLIRHIQKDLA